jgi:hypothetical protein
MQIQGIELFHPSTQFPLHGRFRIGKALGPQTDRNRQFGQSKLLEAMYYPP